MTETITSTFRVALFHPGLIQGGIQRVFLNLAIGFLERGLAVDLVQVSPGGSLRDQVPIGVRLVDLNASRAMTCLAPFVRYLRRERPDAVISGAIQTNLVAAWAKRLTNLPSRLILTEHNIVSVVAESGRTMRAHITPFLVRSFYPWSDAIVAVSNGSADDLASIMRIRRDRIHVIYNPIIGSRFWKQAAEPLSDDGFLADLRPAILAVGRLHFQKDYPTLLRAFAELKQTVDARLIFLGDGEERGRLQDLAKSLGLETSVTFKGDVANPMPYMKHAAALALSSIVEALPTVLIEGLAMGVPIVATNARSGPAEILCDGAYGVLVPVGDSSALAKALCQVIQANYQRTNYIDAIHRFEFNQAVDSYLKIIGPDHINSISKLSKRAVC